MASEKFKEVKLTAKQEMFCREYLIDLNATQAAIRAGYSTKTAKEQAAQHLSKLNIQCRIAELKAEREERIQIDADYVLKQAVKLHERCMQEIKPKNIGGKNAIDNNGNNLFVFDSTGAAKALELIGKHINVQAFKEKIDNDINIKGSIPIEAWIKKNTK